MFVLIKEYEFGVPFPPSAQQSLLLEPWGENWPVVYLLTGEDDLYVGETSSAVRRMIQHGNPNAKNTGQRKKLNCVEIIFDPQFNKSAVLDIEQTLISMFHFEIHEVKDINKKSKRFNNLQNRNQGQSKMHNYYNRALYQDKIKDIWSELKNKGLVKNNYDDIVNDAIFKFSPYKTLNEEQKRISIEIINNILDALENKKPYTAIVRGEAGSGKTIVLMNIMFTIVDALNINIQTFLSPEESDEEDETFDLSEDIKLIKRIIDYKNKYGKPRIAYVAQMLSLRNTIGNVLKNSPHFRKKDSMGPSDVVKSYLKDGDSQPFDILFIDEAHRLENRQNASNIGAFDNTCKRLYGPEVDCKNLTKLDWLIKCSKTQVIVYDAVQSVKASDINNQQFGSAIKSSGRECGEFLLTNQMRCRAGKEYVSYLNDVFNCTITTSPLFPDFELKVIDSNGNDLIKEICDLDKKYGLCKVVTGPHWQWRQKRYNECISQFLKINPNGSREDQINYLLNNLGDEEGIVRFGDKRYVRNMDFDWIIKGDPREIGCIHTCQGYDLNYVGVIFSPEIDYDDDQKKIVINRNLVEDHSVRVKNNDEMIDYIISSYKVMMSRGIRGCYVYACNKKLQEYLKSVFPK